VAPHGSRRWKGLSESDEKTPQGREDWAGRVVSHYEVLDCIGGGGMGVVYRARDQRLGREVALKFLHPERSEEPRVVERFQREALTVSALNHPNICTLYDVGVHESRPYLVLELLEGTTLRTRLGSAPLPVEQVVELGVQIADALEAAHEKDIVHRDIKPGNVFVTPRGRVKVLDFGVAKLLQHGADEPATSATTASTEQVDRGLTRDGSTVGTLAYMSPEQLLGVPLDARSDLFSLGAVLLEMATGRRAFSGPTASAVRQAILYREPGGTASVGGLSPGLLRVIAKALEKDPNRRYASAAELRAELLGVTKTTTAAQPITATLVETLRPRRGRLGLALVAALAVIAVGAAGWLLKGRQAPGRAVAAGPPVVAILPLSLAGDTAASGELSLGATDLLVAALARAPGLNVLSRSATLAYRDRETPPGEIARDLGVDYLVEGTFERREQSVRVTLSLVEPSGLVAWSESFQGTADTLFDLQGRAANALAAALRPGTSGGSATERPPAGATLEALRLYSQGQAFLERPDVPGNLERATERFEAAVASAPDFALAYAGLGQALWTRFSATREPDWADAARRAVEQAVRIDPADPLVRLSLARIDEGTGHLDRAREQLDQLLIAQPDNDEAHRLLGHLLARLGQPAEALAHLQRAVTLRPGYWRNHQELGLAHFDAGRLAAAAAAFERITELQPDLPWGHQMLGTVHHVKGETEAAIASYRRALALGPDALAWANLGALLYGQGQLNEAVEAFEEAVRLEPRVPAHHRNLGDTYQRMGQTESAREAWSEAVRLSQEALEIDPRSAETLGQLAVYEAKLGRGPEATARLGQALALAPEDAGTLYRAAVVHALDGDSPAALRSLAAALEHGWSRAVAREDEDLASLRELSRFQSLVADADTTHPKEAP